MIVADRNRKAFFGAPVRGWIAIDDILGKSQCLMILDAGREDTYHARKLWHNLPWLYFDVCILRLEEGSHFVIVLLRVEILDELLVKQRILGQHSEEIIPSPSRYKTEDVGCWGSDACPITTMVWGREENKPLGRGANGSIASWTQLGKNECLGVRITDQSLYNSTTCSNWMIGLRS